MKYLFWESYTFSVQISNILKGKIEISEGIEKLVKKLFMDRNTDGDVGEGEERVERCECVQVLKHETKITRVTTHISHTHRSSQQRTKWIMVHGSTDGSKSVQQPQGKLHSTVLQQTQTNWPDSYRRKAILQYSGCKRIRSIRRKGIEVDTEWKSCEWCSGVTLRAAWMRGETQSR